MAIFLFSTTACQNTSSTDQTHELATFIENKVEVTISISSDKNGQALLLATFTPQDASLHLYSKDIPRNGVDGLGRPTLLELTAQSQMKAAGKLSESIAAQIPAFEPKDLLVYPAGEVTLTLPITLPEGNDWVDDEISVTYMACSDTGCRAPVIDKIIPVRIPIQ